MARLKQFIKSIPVVGSLAGGLYRMAKGMPALTRLDELTLQVELMRANAQRLALTLAELERERRVAGQAVGEARSFQELRNLGTVSALCTQDQFMTPEYTYWCRQIKEEPVWHRKQWEYYFICQALWERGMVRPGRSGCGFGVGREPLPSLFAALGCTVLATDAPSSATIERHWSRTGQYAASRGDLNVRALAPDDVFRANVEFRAVDMNRIPTDLGLFDFVWSTCALEHLGNIEKSIDFVVNACRCLKPGGVAVHTTEFNVSSADRTLDSGPIVLFRRKDLAEMERRLASTGCRLPPVSFEEGRGLLDSFVAVPPYRSTDLDLPMLRLVIGPYVSTSLALIIEKASR